MNQKELGEIKRRINLEKTNINHIYGWYINTNKDVITTFDQSIGMMNETLAEQYLSLLKKALSGTLGRNLIDMEFSVSQVESSSEHKLLMDLKSSQLRDDSARESLVKKIIDTLHTDEKYLILMAFDSYDIPYRGSDDNVFDDGAEEVLEYIICSICPVKDTGTVLRFEPKSGEFKNSAEAEVGAPFIGFMFPAFDDRHGNIYNSLLYIKNPVEVQDEFLTAIFSTEPPMLQPEQKERFEEALAEAMEGACDYNVLQNIHEKVYEQVEVYKESKEPEPLTMTAAELSGLLHESGVEEERVEVFKKVCEEQFGDDMQVNPTNIIENKKFVVNTSDVVINVKPEKSYLIEAGTHDGKKYIMVNAEGGIEVNGITANIK